MLDDASSANASSRWLYDKNVSLRAVSGCTSGLSVVGSALVILSYLCFRSLRTRARLILVHLALTDMGVAIANLVGSIFNFDHYYQHNHTTDENEEFEPNISIQILCKTQASFAEYCTLSSVLWTSCLAVYMYLLIVNQSQKQMKYFLRVSYVFCYGMPLLVTLWMLLTQRLGYSPYNSAGWCSIIMFKPWIKDNSKFKVDLVADIFGYNLWIVLTIALIVPLYISVFFFVREQFHRVKENTGSKLFWQTMHNMDYKFILIPVMFIFLRVWSLIISILLDYVRVEVPPATLLALIYLAGIGDSGQGFFNAILFVAFTRSVRKQLFGCACLKSRRKNVIPEEKYMQSRHETQPLFTKTRPLSSSSRKYSSVPHEEMIHSSYQDKTISTCSVNSDDTHPCTLEGQLTWKDN